MTDLCVYFARCVTVYSPLSPIQHVVVQVQPSESTSKKAQIEELLDYVMPAWFRHMFVSTYMAFVAQTADPWDVPVN